MHAKVYLTTSDRNKKSFVYLHVCAYLIINVRLARLASRLYESRGRGNRIRREIITRDTQKISVVAIVSEDVVLFQEDAQNL